MNLYANQERNLLELANLRLNSKNAKALDKAENNE